MEQKDKIPLRAAIYARTSSDDKDLSKLKEKDENAKVEEPNRTAQRESIDLQIQWCMDRAAEMGYSIDKTVDVYSDPNFSGRTYPEGHEIPDDAFENYYKERIQRPGKRVRPALGRLISQAERYDIILVRDLYRFFRPAFQSHLGNHLFQFLSKQNIKLLSLEDGLIDSNRFEDLMITNLKLQIADQTKREEVEHSKRSLKKLKNSGFLASNGRCYGFRSVEHQVVAGVPGELKTVRFIYDEYLAGTTVLEITRKLNRDKTTHVPWVTSHPNPGNEKRKDDWDGWGSKLVSSILQRPYYTGLQYNTDGALIESKVFPQPPNSTISREEFYKVQASFKARTLKEKLYQENGLGTQRTTYKGKAKEEPILHILSGLVKCGACRKNLYINTVQNQFYGGGEDERITSTYYICNQGLYNADATNCNQARILELYPQKAFERGSKPSGNGLLETIFPLLFRGYILQAQKDQSPIAGFVSQKEVAESRLGEISTYERRAFEKLNQGKMSDDQFENILSDLRKERDGLKQKMIELEGAISLAKTSDVKIPSAMLLKPQALKGQVLRDLALLTFKEILVYPMKIKIVMTDGHWFELERIKRRNTRILPFWKMRISSSELTATTQIGITYYYRSTDNGIYSPAGLLYSDKNLEVLTVGSNDSLDVRRAPDGLPEEPGNLSKILETVFGPPPGYSRELEVNQTAFFSASAGGVDGVQEVVFDPAE